MLITETTPTKDNKASGAAYWHMIVPNEHPNKPLNVACWVLHAPGYHPWWSWYTVTLVHLRPVEGYEPAKKHFEKATHEVVIFALDPDKPIPASWDGPFNILNPPNIVQQFISRHDAEAFQRIEELLVDCIQGRMSPDSDFRHAWGIRLGTNVIGKPKRGPLLA